MGVDHHIFILVKKEKNCLVGHKILRLLQLLLLRHPTTSYPSLAIIIIIFLTFSKHHRRLRQLLAPVVARHNY